MKERQIRSLRKADVRPLVKSAGRNFTAPRRDEWLSASSCFATWDDYWRDVGVPDEDLGIGADCIIDPDRAGPRIWFQVVPESKTVKNRLHLDIHVSGGRAVPIATRRKRVDAEARRLTDLGATTIRVLEEEGIDHYGSR